MNNINRIKELIKLCNYHRNLYYNNTPEISDEIYDKYFDELSELEKQTNCYFTNSPTQSVGYKVVDSLPKVKHKIPLLSLAKTKSVEDVVKFASNKDVLYMVKADGLTTKISYKSFDGETAELVEASTRGNGFEGSIVTDNVLTYLNIPKKIKFNKELTVVGESVILKSDFHEINSHLPKKEQYSNPRNLASGSISLLDSSICAKRNMRFYLFDVIEGMDEVDSLYDRFSIAKQLGFDIVFHQKAAILNVEETSDVIKNIHKWADDNGFPCDGVVVRFDNYPYALSLGKTSHHYNYGIAKKEEDGLVETTFRGIEWNVSRNGTVVPIGLFDEIEIEGSLVSRATLHNLDYINSLKLKIGDKICVSKRNLIIPAIEVNLDYSKTNYTQLIIDTCPTCGSKLKIKNTGSANVLYCPNEKCASRQLARFVHLVSKNGLNIMGLSEATLDYFIERGWLKTFKDIYHFDKYKQEIIHSDGFGIKSYNKLIDAIEKSRKVKCENYIYALGINNIGLSAAKAISSTFHGDYDEFVQAVLNGYDLTSIKDFGEVMKQSVLTWIRSHDLDDELADEMDFVFPEESNDTTLTGLRFCLTGTFSQPRTALQKALEARGAVFTSSVSKNTDVLFAGSKSGSKLAKAQKLGIRVLGEEELIKMIGEQL